MGLFRSHLIVAWRNMLRYRFYSLINVLGLSLAAAFLFLSYLFIFNELSYDQFHENKDRIYRIFTYDVDAKTGQLLDDENACITSIPLAPALKEDVSGIRRFARYGSNGGTVLQHDIPYKETFTLVDSSFLTMFSFPMLAGDENTALSDPNSIVLTVEKSRKYFKDEDPIGQSISVILNDSTKTFIVTGVIDSKASVSSLQFDFLIPFDRFEMISPGAMNTYNVAFIESYLEFEPDVFITSETLTESVEKDHKSETSRWIIDIQPLDDIHLNPDLQGIAEFTDPQKLWIIVTLSILVMVIAVINFITLSTGHAMNRVKEIGIRKTMGANKKMLSTQLVFEALVVTFVSGILGLLITRFTIPYFNELIDGSVTLTFSFFHILFFFLIVFLVSLISGGIQSAVLIRFSPTEAVKGSKIFSARESWLNQFLIVLQFSFSIILVSGTIVMWSQMNHIQQWDLGFDEERLVQVNLHSSDNPEAAKRLVERFRAEAISDPRILSVGASMNHFRDPWTKLSFQQLEGPPKEVFYNQVDPEFIKTMKINLITGNDFTFSKEHYSKSIIVNEALVKYFEWDDPFGEQIPGKNFDKTHQIIGVVEDFHFSSLHNKIEPLVLALDDDPISSGITGLSTYVWPSNLNYLLVRVGPGDLNDVVVFLEEIWEKIDPGKPFTHTFVDDQLARNYAEEGRWRKVINAASIFAIVIAWMGLLGLTRLSVQKRVKEIGIRKVLGSSIFGVTSLLSKRFLILVVISNVIAWPVAWIFFGRWLETFSYRVDLNVLVFMASGFGVLTIAMISIGIQSLKAATANPVESLRYE